MHRPVQARVLIALLFTLVLAGCLVGPNYTRVHVNAPPSFRGAEGAAQQSSFADLPWWEIFKDDTLKALIQTAFKNNYDLQIAVTRVEQSRQMAAEARAQFFPFVNYGADISAGRNEFLGNSSPNGGVIRGAVFGAVSASW